LDHSRLLLEGAADGSRHESLLRRFAEQCAPVMHQV
jgi:hypothetical protein